MRARSGREEKLWRGAAALTAAIYLSAPFVRAVTDALRERNLLRLAIGAGFAFAAAGVALWLARSGARWRAWGALLLVGGAFLAAALPLKEVSERIHFLEYGALALLCREALAARAAADPGFGFRGAGAASAGAFSIAFVAGVVDEALQALLPSRHGDLRDLGLNAGSAALALVAALALEAALSRDRNAARIESVARR